MSFSNTPPTRNTKVVKAAGIVGGLTFLSRISGYIRDMVVASFLGAGIYTDAFIAAFRIPNLMRRLFGEGSLGVAFVPVFSEYLAKSNSPEAHKLVRAAVRLLVVILVLIVILGFLFAPLIVKVVAPGFVSIPEKVHLTVVLTRIMFPYLFFIGLVALCMAILNTLGHFAAPALAPVFLNMAMITALLITCFFSHSKDVLVIAMAIGVLLGGGFQMALQLPFLMKSGINFWWRGALYHPGLKKVGRLMLPAILGSAVYQINILIGTLLASQLSEGSISYLYYADRLVQFPLGIFAVALGTAVLPTLSRQATDGNFTALKETFSEALCLIFFLTLPAMVGLIVLRETIVILLFQRGAFDAQASQLTADALLYYGMGLWAYAAIRVVLPTFYALQNTWTPVKSAIVSIGANSAFGIVLMKLMGHCGLALATALASILNFLLLALSLHFRLGALKWYPITVSILKSLLCASLMGWILWQIDQMSREVLNQSRILLSGQLIFMISMGVVLFILFAKTLNLQEVKLIFGMIKRSKKTN
jgi:putative peptidoglycan lipid II flippase